ncbi:MAG: dihydrolipoyl dehydrogenase [Lentisphaerae bacterium]|nr:dihydrolipoyl dehydrogenase [Lentisphaerota bacterium]
MEKFDVTVIGAGPGGYPAALRAAQLGARTALIEKEVLGGTCLNWGCIPTKSLIASAERFHQAAHGDALGLRAADVGFDYGVMWKRKNDVVAKLRGGVGQLLKAHGVTVFNGAASFAARNRIAVAPASGAPHEIDSGAVIIATGSVSAVPGFLPESEHVVESRAFLDQPDLPQSLIVLGGGVIGCEFACLAARLGVRVTVVELLEDILTGLDRDAVRVLRKSMEKTLHIRILTGSPLEQVAVSKHGVQGRFGRETLSAERLLVSVGRRPVTAGLALENAGLRADEHGFIEIDAACATAAAGVYAVGDVTAGSTQLAHAATSQGVTAAENAVRGARAAAETLVPACVFTAPEIGSVGLTEAAVRQAGRSVRTGLFAFAGLGKALAADETEGFVKWIADAETDQLLGAHAVGAHATELIAEAALAVRQELTAEEVGRTIHCHPTFAEAWMEAAHAAHGTCLHQPPKRR